MTGIKDLPNELLDIIFQYVDDIECNKRKVYRAPALPDSPSRAIFPLNVASVCPLWLKILKYRIAYWHCAVIDVADDPTPFLETLTFHERMPETHLGVLVFSSSPNISKDTESERARVIYAALAPCIARYSGIAFQLVYQSSLPSALDIVIRGLTLFEIRLTCTVHDRDNEETSLYTQAPHSTPFSQHSVETHLRKITLTGYDFIRLCCDIYFVPIVRFEHDFFKLTVSHFTFGTQRDGNSLRCDDLRNVIEFLEPLGDHVAVHLALSDLSLDYNPYMQLSLRDSFLIHRLSFDNVSAGFLLAFFSSIAYFSPYTELEFLSFRRCTIPSFEDQIFTDMPDLELELVDMNCQPSVIAETPHTNKCSNSISNIVRAFLIKDLRMLRCDGVTNSLFTQFTALKAPFLKTLTIQDCTGFTSDRIRSFLIARRRAAKPVTKVVVSGKGSALTVGTSRWIQRESHWLNVEWNVERDNTFAWHDIWNLHPLTAENKPRDTRLWGIPW